MVGLEVVARFVLPTAVAGQRLMSPSPVFSFGNQIIQHKSVGARVSVLSFFVPLRVVN